MGLCVLDHLAHLLTPVQGRGLLAPDAIAGLTVGELEDQSHRAVPRGVRPGSGPVTAAM